MARQHTEVALGAGQIDLFYLSRDQQPTRRNEIEIKFSHDGVPSSNPLV
jgi:hypothetical protein